MSDLKQGYLTPLRVENIDAKNWRYLERFGWRGSEDDELWIEAGETTDFATVPWWSQFITPRTGTWTKAAGIHDKMCNLLNKYHELMEMYEAFVGHGIHTQDLPVPIEPAFSSIDTDAIFRKNARDEGTDRVRSEILWFGVRTGSLFNAARREKWMSTFPRYFFDLVWILGLVSGIVALISWAWPW